MPQSPFFIINPAAAGGRVMKWWRRALPTLRTEFAGMQWAVSDSSLSLHDVLALAAEQHTLIVGVGGDGTHHDIVNAIVRQGLLHRLTYAPLPFGSGNDWCRTLRLPHRIYPWVKTVKAGKTLSHAIGELLLPGSQVHYFINVAGLAYDAEVVRQAAKYRWKHRLMYPLLTAALLPRYRPPELRLEYDDRVVEGRFHTINMGIGRYSGGGLRLVPQADPGAESLALTYAVDLPVGRIVANSWRFYTDTIGRVEGVTTTHISSEVKITGATGAEADGEYLGRTPLVARLHPHRLRVIRGD